MAKIQKLVETKKIEQGVLVHPEHVPVHFGFWWGVPVHPCTCTGTPFENLPRFVVFATLATNSLPTTSSFLNSSKNPHGTHPKQLQNTCIGGLGPHTTNPR